jgi:hypothetical protein
VSGAPSPAAPYGPAFFRAMALVALLGTGTTLYNTVAWIFLTIPQGGVDAQARLARDPLYMSREWVLIFHAVFTWLAPLALAIRLRVHAPGLVTVAALCTSVEKLVELLGWTARVFVLNGTWREQLLSSADPQVQARARLFIQGFAELWDAAYFVLWGSAGLAGLCFGLALVRRPGLPRALALSMFLVTALTWQSLAADYLRQAWLAAAWTGAAFAPVFGLNRLLIAWALWRHERLP